MIDLIVPELDVDPAERIILSTWLAEEGDEVIEGDRLVELLMDEITIDLPSPVTGRLVRILVEVDEEVSAGSVLAWIRPE